MLAELDCCSFSVARRTPRIPGLQWRHGRRASPSARPEVDMPDVREIPAVLEAATQAAASGDLAAAEALLHDVVRLQEASVGPRHPDLASTFNNLAVVCEMANKPTDAEQFYRRAYAIASASLDPHDPLVATSLNNLKEFCHARGVALDLPVERRAESAPVAATVAPTTPAVPARGTERVVNEVVPPTASRASRSSRTVVVGALAAVVLLTALVVFWSRRQTDGPDASGEPASPVVVAPAPAAPSEPAPQVAAPAPPAPPVADAPARTAAARPAPGRATSTRVLEAMVCQALSTGSAEWKCTAPSNPAAPGRLSFYTRVAASEDIRVRHRWYHGDRLVQDVGLTVRANPTGGYRTFSRQTVSNSGGGEWRVEIRTADGALLREQRIAVR